MPELLVTAPDEVETLPEELEVEDELVTAPDELVTLPELVEVELVTEPDEVLTPPVEVETPPVEVLTPPVEVETPPVVDELPPVDEVVVEVRPPVEVVEVRPPVDVEVDVPPLVLSRMPPVMMKIPGPAPRAPALLRFNWPASSAKSAVKVLAPESVSVPVPRFVMAALPTNGLTLPAPVIGFPYSTLPVDSKTNSPSRPTLMEELSLIEPLPVRTSAPSVIVVEPV